VRDAVIVAFPDRRTGTGLYAFIEGAPELTEQSLREFIALGVSSKPPEHVQVVDQLPRRSSGEVRTEILELVARNQLDLLECLIIDEHERSLVDRIIAERRNLRDRFAF
jgi:acyl-CoA synthetase (AMP-forming)/AMP-acid ligase II